ncbi:MAG: DEAD/DEAH box helicase family protein [Tomitella sp.]|nr:DEAD/DEAH box helicase family protein [Tomitella sp.]
MPFRAQPPGARYYRSLGAYAHVGPELPVELRRYRSRPYSYARWREDEFNGHRGPGASAPPKTPRPQQVEGARAIATAYKAGWRGFWLGDDMGVGKTGTAVLAAKAVCHLGGKRRILITVDRPAAITIPAWRDAVAAYGGDGGFEWLIMSPDQLGKIIAANGRPKYRFDVVINDEAQQFRHLTAKRTGYMRRINRLTDAPGAAPFVISATATLGHHPGEYTYLSALFAQIHHESPGAWTNLGARLVRSGLPLERGWEKGKWQWTDAAKSSQALQNEAVTTVRPWMDDTSPPVALHRRAAWGPAPVDGLPVEFTAEQWSAYDQEWGEFQRAMQLARTGRDTARGRAAVTRFRQKASMLRVPQTVDMVEATVQAGNQVLVAVEFTSTAAKPIADTLEERGMRVARIFGGGDLEDERLQFQRGHAPVVVFNTTSAINLQASEQLADGSYASTTPRVGFFHQPRYSGIQARQTIGRAHRDGQVCPWNLLYAADTIEETAGRTMIDRLLVTSTSAGGDTSTLGRIARLFGADWLPETVFE